MNRCYSAGGKSWEEIQAQDKATEPITARNDIAVLQKKAEWADRAGKAMRMLNIEKREKVLTSLCRQWKEMGF